MPQVVEVEGYRVMVYTRDEHPPAHVHVAKNASTIRVLLHAGSVEYESYDGAKPKPQERRRAVEIVAEHFDACWKSWRTHHAHGSAKS